MPRSPAASPTDLVQCAAAGMTQAEAARALGIPPYSVRWYGNKLGLTFARKPTRLEVWARCAEQGMTAAQAAEALCTTLPAAYMAAKRYGLTFRRAPRLADFSRRDRLDYNKLRRSGVSRNETLRTIGYGDHPHAR